MIDYDALLLGPCMQVFGETVTYFPYDGFPILLSGTAAPVYFDRYTEVKFENNTDVSQTRPMLGARSAAFAREPLQGEFFRIRGQVYVVVEPPEADGVGGLKIILGFASDADAVKLQTAPIAS